MNLIGCKTKNEKNVCNVAIGRGGEFLQKWNLKRTLKGSNYIMSLSILTKVFYWKEILYSVKLKETKQRIQISTGWLVRKYHIKGKYIKLYTRFGCYMS